LFVKQQTHNFIADEVIFSSFYIVCLQAIWLKKVAFWK